MTVPSLQIHGDLEPHNGVVEVDGTVGRWLGSSVHDFTARQPSIPAREEGHVTQEDRRLCVIRSN